MRPPIQPFCTGQKATAAKDADFARRSQLKNTTSESSLAQDRWIDDRPAKDRLAITGLLDSRHLQLAAVLDRLV
jgi:hypothetical protein